MTGTFSFSSHFIRKNKEILGKAFKPTCIHSFFKQSSSVDRTVHKKRETKNVPTAHAIEPVILAWALGSTVPSSLSPARYLLPEPRVDIIFK